MNAHQIYNLLESRISLYELKNGIHEYPQELIDRYNQEVANINRLRDLMLEAITCMTELEEEAVRHVTKNYGKMADNKDHERAIGL